MTSRGGRDNRRGLYGPAPHPTATAGRATTPHASRSVSAPDVQAAGSTDANRTSPAPDPQPDARRPRTPAGAAPHLTPTSRINQSEPNDPAPNPQPDAH
ncbi:hypothetical protein TNCT1_38840 [Streptomyces sp. 1-11]|nr:hypothetical protein TNCT1_38840 [Streptomyces sp. 1-11]